MSNNEVKSLLSFFALLILFPSIVAAQIDKNALDKIARIYVELNDTKSINGTGFVIDKNVFITSYHTIYNARKIYIYDSKKNEYKNLSLLGIDKNNDIAVFKINNSDFSYWYDYKDIIEHLPNLQDNYYSISIPRGMDTFTFNGNATHSNYKTSLLLSNEHGNAIFNKSIDLIIVDMTCYGGMSGAPLLSDEGKIIGIIEGSLGEQHGLTWAIPSKSLLKLLTLCLGGSSILDDVNAQISTIDWRSESYIFDLTNISGKNMRAFTTDKSFHDIDISYKKSLDTLSKLNPEISAKTIFGSDLCTQIDSVRNTLQNLHDINDILSIYSVQFENYKDEVNNISGLIENRLKCLELMNHANNKLRSLLDSDSISNAEKEELRNDIHDIQYKHSIVFDQSYEESQSININAITNFNNKLSQMSSLHFPSIASINNFLITCRDYEKNISKYSDVGTMSLPIQNSENLFYQESLALIIKYKEYLIYN